MPFDLYRRHVAKCPDRAKGVYYTGCNCPVWAYGRFETGGHKIRHAVGTRDWQRARRILDRWITENSHRDPDAPPAAPELGEAIADYIKDCRSRKLAASTIKSYEKSLDHFAAAIRVEDVSRIRVEHVAGFRNRRAGTDGRAREDKHVSAKTLRKEIETVRAFCEFLVDRDWLRTNPARKVRPPKDTAPPTLPFTPDEVKALIAATDKIDNNNATDLARTRARARGLVLLLLYSGMRISDVVKLERSRLAKDGRLMLRMMKTGEPLYIKLGKSAIDALQRIPEEGKYFLWSGKSSVSTATGSARRTIDCLGEMAGINAHPHRFRDTFSVELLRTGAPLRTVQLLLGHTSIRTTERHYAPWVRAFQQQLDRATAKLKF